MLVGPNLPSDPLSTGDGGESGLPSGTPLGNLPARSAGSRGLSFTINLVFPGTDRRCRGYRVYEQMPVRTLYNRIALHILSCQPRDIRIYVDGTCLLHTGTISDRFYPHDITSPTVYLVHGSTATIRTLDRSGFRTFPDDTLVSPTPAPSKPVSDQATSEDTVFITNDAMEIRESSSPLSRAMVETRTKLGLR
jgi:hypothetical protein